MVGRAAQAREKRERAEQQDRARVDAVVGEFDRGVAKMAEEIYYWRWRIERLVEVVTKFESLVERRENGSCRNIPWTSGPR